MVAFKLPSLKFDKLDYLLSSIVTDQMQCGHTWVIEPILRFITACPKIKFTLTHYSCSMVWQTSCMLTREQKDMLKPDGVDTSSMSIGSTTMLFGAFMDLLQDVVQPTPSICTVEYIKADQALNLCNLIIDLAKDLGFSFVFMNSLKQVREQIIAYRAAVVRGYDEQFPNDDPYARPLGYLAY